MLSFLILEGCVIEFYLFKFNSVADSAKEKNTIRRYMHSDYVPLMLC